ncbi:MAG: energy transducer TonB [Acidobacteriaceae bacterium]
MRARAAVLAAVSVGLMVQTALGQGVLVAPPSPRVPPPPPPVLLRMATADTIDAPINVLVDLAVSEPGIAAPEGAPQIGLVAMKVLVSKTGTVEEVAPSRGDDALRKAAAAGVMGWKYRPYLVNGEPREFETLILIRFVAGVGTRMPTPFNLMPNPAMPGATPDTIAVPIKVLDDLAVSQPGIVAPEGAPQIGLVTMNVLMSKTGTVEEVAPSRGDDALQQAAKAGVMGWKYRPFLVFGEPREFQTAMMIRFVAGVGTRVPAPPTGMAGSLGSGSGSPGPEGPVKVSSGVVAGLLSEPVAPVYPLEAKRQHVEGVVVLHAIISKDGTIKELRVMSGPPLLQKAATDAVMRWKYHPYLIQGVPVEVETTINVNFTFGAPKPEHPPIFMNGAPPGAAAPAATPDPK